MAVPAVPEGIVAGAPAVRMAPLPGPGLSATIVLEPESSVPPNALREASPA